jgi:hypothetical protein
MVPWVRSLLYSADGSASIEEPNKGDAWNEITLSGVHSTLERVRSEILEETQKRLIRFRSSELAVVQSRDGYEYVRTPDRLTHLLHKCSNTR